MDSRTANLHDAVTRSPEERATIAQCVTLLTILVLILVSNLIVLWAVLLGRIAQSYSGGLTRSESLSRIQLFMVHPFTADVLVALLNIAPQLA